MRMLRVNAVAAMALTAHPGPLAALFWPVVAGGLAALVIGFFSTRVSGVYFIMLTLAFSQMLYAYAFQNPSLGAEDGINGVPRPELLGVALGEGWAFHLYVVALTAGAALFLWRVASMAEEAHQIERAWGFKHKTEIVWEKQSDCSKCRGTGKLGGWTKHAISPRFRTECRCEKCDGTGKNRWFGMGRITRASHEVCLVATRGRPEVLDRSVRSLFSAVVPDRRHSAKPPEFYAIVERLFAGPYCELFAREVRPGWTQYGHQLGEASG